MLTLDGVDSCISYFHGAFVCGDCGNAYALYSLFDVYNCNVFVCFGVYSVFIVCLFCLDVVCFIREWNGCKGCDSV